MVHYRDYVIRADKVIYNRTTTELEADGHLQVTGGPNDVLINASHGDMRLNMHTARFYNVNGSQGVRAMGHTVVYSTPNPLLFSGRVLLQTGEGSYRIIDGSMTNCRLPHPDWRIIAHSIDLDNDTGIHVERVLRVSRHARSSICPTCATRPTRPAARADF